MAKSLSQTPAPAKDRIKGSKVNPKGSASSEKSATEIKFDAKTIVALNNKLKEFREKHRNENITLNDLKAVYRRGLGAYSTSHRPNITRGGGAMARVNAFLKKAGGGDYKKAYVQDDDLMKYENGALIENEFDEVLKSFYHDLTNSEIFDYLGLKNGNYTLGDNEFVIFRDKNFSNVEKIKIVSFIQPYFRNYQIVGKKIIIKLKDKYVNGGEVTYSRTYADGYVQKFSVDDYEKNVYPYLGKGGALYLAPNGKASNLNENQWKLVRTPEFKTWFGDWENDPANASQVIDENGEPLVCYHGTYYKEQFNVFDFDKADLGFHFGTYQQAKERSETKIKVDGYKRIVNPYFLNIKLLVETKDVGEWEYPQSYIDMFISDGLILENDAKKLGFYKAIYKEENKKIRDYLINKYNGELGFCYNNKIESEGESYLVLLPTQIKLADGTNKTFDMNNPDIRYSDGGEVSQDIKCRRCGWEWNTSQSEEFDKYVCHNCGFDNRMYYDVDPIGYADGGLLSQQGTLYTKDKNKKLEYYKKGNDYAFKVYDVENKTNENEALMNYNQFINYLYSELYIDEKYVDGGEVNKHKETYAKWKSLVNMSYGEIKKFYDSKEGKEAGLSTSEANKQGISSGRESARMLMKMKITPKDKWTDTMWKWANKQISFISRMSGMQGELYDEKGNKTRKHTSLLIWGHNPKKSSSMKYAKGGKFDEKEIIDFAKNSKFKVSKSNDYTYFNINDEKQIRITKVGGKYNKGYRVTLHEISEDGIAYKKDYLRNDLATDLQDAKKVAGKIYFDVIREGEIEEIDITDNNIDYSKITTDELKKLLEKTNDFSEMANIKKELDYRKMNPNIRYADGGEMDVRMEDTVQRMDNPNFADISYYDNGGMSDYGKVVTSSSRFKPRETIVFDPPLIGINGNKLISYTWSYEWTEDFNKFKGETVNKRISDWTQAETNAETGRQIVHQYGIQLADGTYKTVSSETVPIILGFLDKKQSTTLPNLVTASKTLAKQKMQLAILEAKKIEKEDAIKEIMSKPFPQITKSIAFGDAIRYTMGKVSVIDHNSDINSEIDKERKEALIDSYVKEQLKEIGINVYENTNSYELKNRIQRQEKKIQNILENKMENGGELQGLTRSEIDTNVHKIATKFKLPLEYINSQLKLGIKFEMEHTKDKSIASKIALDHLNESPYYYQKLTEMEKELDTMKMDADTYLPKVMSAYKNGGEVDMIFKLNTPTKQPTKLNYIQQILVRTTEFKKWFGDWEKCAESFLQDNKSNFLQHYKNCSIVIDLTTLEPQVVYHGTNFKEEFYTFDVTKKEGVGRPYGYFADNIEYSQNFTTNSQRGQHGLELLYKCFLNIRNPFMAITEDFYDELDNKFGWALKIAKAIAKKNYGETVTLEQISETLKVVMEQIGSYIYATFGLDDKPFWLLMARDTKKEFKYFLMSHGFDGVRYAEEFKGVYDVDNPAEFTKAWTIFDANQVKLADGRNIDFDPFKEDIRYEEGGSLTELNQEDMQQENMSKAQMLRNTIGVNKFAEGGTVKGDGKHTNDAKKGGFFDGRSHAEGGIKAVNKDTGQMLEVEGNEVIINKRSVADDTKREFEGKMMTNREILSTINEMGGGVSFKEGGEINEKSCKCMGKKYKFGGNLISDYDIVKELTTSYNDVIKKPISNSINYVENLINKINGKF